MKIYGFGNCLINLTERRVLKNGKFLKLTPKAFDVLQMLIERSGEIVSKDEILGTVWSGSFVEEGNLAVHVSKLRRILNESDNEYFIETVTGNGYRFVAAVDSADIEQWQAQIAEQNPFHIEKKSQEFLLDSIAVLPLVNESGNEEIDYLADGLTESFINSLSHIPALKVIARNTVFRYKNNDVDVEEVGATLGVATILTGRIRLIKDRLMISVELTKTEDGRQLWGKQFNHPFSDIIEIQEQIVSAVSSQLQTEIKNVTNKSDSALITNNPESYKFYLKGKYLFDKRKVEYIHKAIECFQKSVSYDPNNVHAYVGIVDCLMFFYFFEHASFDETCVKINPYLLIISGLNQNVDFVQSLLAAIEVYFTWNFEKAEVHLQYALKLNPNHIISLYRYADVLSILNRNSEGFKYLQKAVRIDCLSALTYKRIGRSFYKIGRFETAIVYLEDSIELDPEDFETYSLLGASLVEIGRFSEAINLFYRSLAISDNVEALSLIGYTNALEGKEFEAKQIINQLESQIDNGNKPIIHIARIYAALGETEIVFELLDQSFERHEIDLSHLSVDPRWGKIRNDTRFTELCKKIGLVV